MVTVSDRVLESERRRLYDRGLYDMEIGGFDHKDTKISGNFGR